MSSSPSLYTKPYIYTQQTTYYTGGASGMYVRGGLTRQVVAICELRKTTHLEPTSLIK